MKKVILTLTLALGTAACHHQPYYHDGSHRYTTNYRADAPMLEEELEPSQYNSYYGGVYWHNNKRVYPSGHAYYFSDTTYTPPYIGLEAPMQYGQMPHLPRQTYRPFQDVPSAYAYDQARTLPPLFWSRQFQHNIDEAMLSAPNKALYRFNVDGQDYHWVMNSALFSHPYKALPCREGALYLVNKATLPIMVGDYTLCRVGPRHEWLPNTL